MTTISINIQDRDHIEIQTWLSLKYSQITYSSHFYFLSSTSVYNINWDINQNREVLWIIEFFDDVVATEFALRFL